MDYDEYVTVFAENVKRPRQTEYVECVDADIEAVLAPFIRKVNQETEWETRSTCSGAFADHFDVDGLRNDGIEFSDDAEFRLAFLKAAPRRVSISFKDMFHQIQSEERDPPFETDVVVDGEYYKFQDMTESIIVHYNGDGLCFPFSVKYHRKMLPQWVTVEVTIDRYAILEYADSFEKYDEFVSEYISIIEDVFLNYDSFIKGEFTSTMEYNLITGEWVSEEDSEVDF